MAAKQKPRKRAPKADPLVLSIVETSDLDRIFEKLAHIESGPAALLQRTAKKPHVLSRLFGRGQ